MDETLNAFSAEFRRHLKLSYSSEADHITLDAMTLDELIFAACVLDDRSIHVHPRQVVMSKELRERQLRSEIAEQLERVADDCMAGKNLNPRLNDLPKLKADPSKDQLKLVSDQLLVQHGIYHLHLGCNGDLRSNELLFACFARGIAFFIDVAAHDFSPQRYLDIVLRDYPELAGYEEIRDIHGVRKLPGKSDLNTSLYRSPMGYICKSGGKFFVQVSRKGSTFGTSLNARERADHILGYCEDMAAFNREDGTHQYQYNVKDVLLQGAKYVVGIDVKGRLASYDPQSKTLYPSGFEFTV